jgi:hypothetical protein
MLARELTRNDIDVLAILYKHSKSMVSELKRVVSFLPVTKFYILASQLSALASNDLADLCGENTTSDYQRISNAVRNNQRIFLCIKAFAQHWQAVNEVAVQRNFDNKSYLDSHHKIKTILDHLLQDSLEQWLASRLVSVNDGGRKIEELFDVMYNEYGVPNRRHLQQKMDSAIEKFNDIHEKKVLTLINQILFERIASLSKTFDLSAQVPALMAPEVDSQSASEYANLLDNIAIDRLSDKDAFFIEITAEDKPAQINASSFHDMANALLDDFLVAPAPVSKSKSETIRKISGELVTVNESYYETSFGFYEQNEKQPVAAVIDFDIARIKEIVEKEFSPFTCTLPGFQSVAGRLVKLLARYTIDASLSESISQKISNCFEIRVKSSFLLFHRLALELDEPMLSELDDYLQTHCKLKMQSGPCVIL